MFGLTYLQQISDANLKAGLHIEPGLWLAIPQTSNPSEAPTVARLASIPHGTAIVAQGTASTAAGAPAIPNTSIRPFTIGQPLSPVEFPEETPVPGGGTANTAFLKGAGPGPNAVSVSVNATFWLETIEGTPAIRQLQYAQTVLLNFSGLSWPHITIGTLRQLPGRAGSGARGSAGRTGRLVVA